MRGPRPPRRRRVGRQEEQCLAMSRPAAPAGRPPVREIGAGHGVRAGLADGPDLRVSLRMARTRVAGLPADGRRAGSRRTAQGGLRPAQVLARPFGDCGVEGGPGRRASSTPRTLKEQLRQVHYRILENLAADNEQLSAYQLGRALSEYLLGCPRSAWTAPSFSSNLDRHRLALLRSWMTQGSRCPAPSVRLYRGPVPAELAGLGGYQRRRFSHHGGQTGPPTRPASRTPWRTRAGPGGRC